MVKTNDRAGGYRRRRRIQSRRRDASALGRNATAGSSGVSGPTRYAEGWALRCKLENFASASATAEEEAVAAEGPFLQTPPPHPTPKLGSPKQLKRPNTICIAKISGPAWPFPIFRIISLSLSLSLSLYLCVCVCVMVRWPLTASASAGHPISSSSRPARKGTEKKTATKSTMMAGNLHKSTTRYKSEEEEEEEEDKENKKRRMNKMKKKKLRWLSKPPSFSTSRSQDK